MYELYWSPATGAFVVEAVLEELGLAYERVSTITGQGEHRRPEYVAMNPLQQIPSLVLPDGTVMTETAAMHHASVRLPAGSGLLPEPGTSERARGLSLAVLARGQLLRGRPALLLSRPLHRRPEWPRGGEAAAVQRMDRLLSVIEKAAGARALALGRALLGGRPLSVHAGAVASGAAGVLDEPSRWAA